MTDQETQSVKLKLPGRLRICEVCGEARGWSGREKSVCLCEGVSCRRCGERNVRRPLTNYSDWREGGWWHVAWFGYMKSCPQCQQSASAPATGGEEAEQRSGLIAAERELVDVGAS